MSCDPVQSSLKKEHIVTPDQARISLSSKWQTVFVEVTGKSAYLKYKMAEGKNTQCPFSVPSDWGNSD